LNEKLHDQSKTENNFKPALDFNGTQRLASPFKVDSNLLVKKEANAVEVLLKYFGSIIQNT